MDAGLSLRLASVVAAGLGLLVSGCGGPDFTKPSLSGLVVSEAQPQESSRRVQHALITARTLSARVGHVRGACLEAQGYPQFNESLSLRRPAQGAFTTGPLAIPMIEFGPSTRAEASRFGFGGAETAVDDGDHGFLISKSSEFDRVGTRCDEWLYDELAPGLELLQTRAAKLSGRAGTDLARRVSRAIEPLLLERLRCVRRHGYPQLEPAAVLSTKTGGDLLAAVGVAPGQLVQEPFDADSRVRAGEIGVFPPPPAPTYRPSRAEVALASVYADCGLAQHFRKRARAVVRQARLAVEHRWGVRAEQLAAEITRMLPRLRGADN